jgi:histidinol-phosphate aminotransferase
MNERIDSLVRENIRRLTPYSSARLEFAGSSEVFLDANENSLGSPIGCDVSRYPDPVQTKLRNRLARMHGVRASQVFVGNGSDEAIDLLIRIFCRPQIDSIIVCPPTYGMYEVAAAVNDVAVVRVPLRNDFSLDPDALRQAFAPETKILFLCSPNNPTGNLLDRGSMLDVIRDFPGMVVVDEAYLEFSGGETLISEIGSLANLVVIRTLSKAWGLAGLRIGYAIAGEAVIEYLLRVKPPYNVNRLSQELALEALANSGRTGTAVVTIVSQRELLAERIAEFHFVERVFPSTANFILVRTSDAAGLYRFLLERRIVVRDRSRVAGCEGCLRITVGTEAENEQLLEALASYEKSVVYRS